MGEQVCPSLMLLATLAMSLGICDGTPSTAHSSFTLFFFSGKHIVGTCTINNKCLGEVLSMSTHTIFLWRNNKNSAEGYVMPERLTQIYKVDEPIYGYCCLRSSLCASLYQL